MRFGKVVIEDLKPSSREVEVKKKTWHSYSDLVHKKDGSEVNHLHQLNHFQEKFNRHVYMKTKADKMQLKAIKKNLDRPYGNEVMIHWNSDSEFINKPVKGTNKKY